MKRKESFNAPQVQALCLQKQGKGKYQYKGGQDIQHPDRLISAILSPTASVMIPPHALKLDSMVSVTNGSM